MWTKMVPVWLLKPPRPRPPNSPKLLMLSTHEKLIIVPREANAPNGGHRIHVSASVRLCVRPSVPNRGGTLCARLSPNRFTYLRTLDANQLYNHCRCATYLSFWPWLYFRSRTRSQKTLFSCILYIRWVVLCVRDSAQTAPHIFTYLVPINCTIIVDVQHTFHFDLDFISDPGQGHKKTYFVCIFYIRWVVLCVRDSAQTASHISTYLVPINCTIIVDVQHTFQFDLDFISDPGQGHKKLSFSAYFI